MSLAFGNSVIAIPGPSPIPDRVLRATQRASPDIYGTALPELNSRVMTQLKKMAGTKTYLAPYIGNGHAVWEAAAANMLNPGDLVLLLMSGHFGRSWAGQLSQMGINVEVLDFGNSAPDPDRLADRLAQDKTAAIKAVLVCQTDTASSATADIPAIRNAIGKHPALLVVDAIASLGCTPMHMDDWGVDVLLSASQKGLMCPPGAAFLWFSEKAAQAGPTSLTTPVWDWRGRAEADALWQFWYGTPPVQMLFALDEALTMILEEEGLDAIWNRHTTLARSVWAAIEAWGAGNDGIRLTVKEPVARAASVTALSLPGADALRTWVTENTGVTLGVGLGAADPANALRIGHMGYCNAAMIFAVLGAMEAGMTALSIPHGKGAIEAAAKVIAGV